MSWLQVKGHVGSTTFGDIDAAGDAGEAGVIVFDYVTRMCMIRRLMRLPGLVVSRSAFEACLERAMSATPFRLPVDDLRKCDARTCILVDWLIGRVPVSRHRH